MSNKIEDFLRVCDIGYFLNHHETTIITSKIWIWIKMKAMHAPSHNYTCNILYDTQGIMYTLHTFIDLRNFHGFDLAKESDKRI